MRGRLIVLEGIDSSGKETQSKLLKEYLVEKTWRTIKGIALIEFPNYDSDTGKCIRRYLDGKEYFSQRIINMLYSANRYEKRDRINYLINFGHHVICDRYYYSNMAYGSDENNTMESIEAMDSEMPVPDMIIYIDITAEESLKRSGKNADINERNLSYLKKVRDKYLKLAFDRQEWILLNGKEDKQEIHEQIIALVEKKLFK